MNVCTKGVFSREKLYSEGARVPHQAVSVILEHIPGYDSGTH